MENKTPLVNAFANGSISNSKLYTVLFDSIPSTHIFRDDMDTEGLDLKNINPNDLIPYLLGTIINYRTFSHEIIKEEDQRLGWLEDDSGGILEDTSGIIYTFVGNRIIFEIKEKLINVYYDNSLFKIEDVANCCSNLYKELPKKKPRQKEATVELIKVSQGEYYTESAKINKTNVDIDENYNDDFKPVYQDIIDFLNSRSSGLILLFGLMGSGKTNFIRHLCTNFPNDYVIVPNSIAQRLGDPDFISFITSHKDSIFILEDCEQLLVDRSENEFNSAISTILNMSDGILSDIANIKFICTFNADITKLDQALTRKGRCFAKYKFDKLCAEKVAKLNEKYNLNLSEIKDMTLAEVYNNGKTDYTEVSIKKKIGF